MDPVATLLDQLSHQPEISRAALRRLKREMARHTRSPLIRNDLLLGRYRSEISQGLRQPDPHLERTLQLNAIRSTSGLATVTVVTEPYPCPGRCVYCPTEARAPKSYLTNEPAVMRALRNDYDPYRQVHSRLKALDETGHSTEKIELIIKGGTWSFYPDAYQREFIQRCFEAANDFASSFRLQASGQRSSRKPQATGQHAESPEACSLEPAALEETQHWNETAAHRIIGVTIETRPDYIEEAEIRRLRELGVTRVELGVQTLDDRVLNLIVRDHGTEEVRHATRLLRDAAFKIAYHLMPNLPGASPEDDRATFHTLFDDPAYRPDAIKIYPCVVIETAELHRWWQQGRYQPYDDDTLLELLIQLKMLVPPYVRIERVIRDIPSTSIRGGCTILNLREDVHRRMRSRGVRCRCIRCRQVRADPSDALTLIRRDYDAADGRETFLSFEDAATDQLASFLRLRIPSTTARHVHWLPVLDGAALIREVHTYGQQMSFHQRDNGAVQHRGLGKQLIEEAERIAATEWGVRRLAVIAGVGVREYYRSLGYTLQDTYMVKTLRHSPAKNPVSGQGMRLG
ncbi:MAG: tRNA uridine(34) 5-carboxymethylaminomethyl modification radical SAM/GNAT enzyme Elp3 [Candidatus Omnitrophica bacterium]|nr:tRNA uridine(34) 5-carboxymethylaminomethyl modification radical SAM/GNAT enzyme Elp3 [Candidatus Omnitrophota bacterium]